jgi:hypothetical protein
MFSPCNDIFIIFIIFYANEPMGYISFAAVVLYFRSDALSQLL